MQDDNSNLVQLLDFVSIYKHPGLNRTTELLRSEMQSAIKKHLDFDNETVDYKKITAEEQIELPINKHIGCVIYTDGGCDNTGDKVGGWGIHAYWYVDKSTTSNSGVKGASPTKEGYVSGKLPADMNKVIVLGYADWFGSIPSPTTNNIAEMVALTMGFYLASLMPYGINVTILTDSDYVRKGYLEYLPRWKASDWRKGNGEPVANKDHWELLEAAGELAKFQVYNNKINLKRVDGHSGDLGNDMADANATAGMWGYRYNSEFKSEYLFKLADEYWNKETTPNLFTESRLLLTENIEPGLYYQYNLPTSANSSGKNILGKRIADLLIGIVKLNKPCDVVDELHKHAIEDRNMDGIIKGRLDFIGRVQNMQYLVNQPIGPYLVHNDRINTLSLPDKTQLLARVNTTNLVYRLFTQFDFLKVVLSDYLNKTNEKHYDTLDITDYMYTTTMSNAKKPKPVTKVNPDLDNSVTIEVDIDNKKYPVILTLGVDIPNKLGLNKLKGDLPKVTLVIEKSIPTQRRYFIVFDTNEGSAIYCAPFSNEIICL